MHDEHHPVSYSPWWSSGIPAPAMLLPPLELTTGRTQQVEHDELQDELPRIIAAQQQQSMNESFPMNGTSAFDAEVPRSLPELWPSTESQDEEIDGITNGDEPLVPDLNGAGWSTHTSLQPHLPWATSSTSHQQLPEFREHYSDEEDELDDSGFEPPTGLLPPLSMTLSPIRIREAEQTDPIASPAVERSAQRVDMQRTPLRSRRDTVMQRSASFTSIRSLSMNMGLGTLPAVPGASNAPIPAASPYHTSNELSGSSVRLSGNGGGGGFPNVSTASHAGGSMLSPSIMLRSRSQLGGGAGQALDLAYPWWPRVGVQADLVRQRPPSFGAVHPEQIFHSSTDHAYPSMNSNGNGRGQPNQPSSPRAHDEGDLGPSAGYMQPPSPSLGPARKRARTRIDGVNELPGPSGPSPFAQQGKTAFQTITQASSEDDQQRRASVCQPLKENGSQQVPKPRRRLIIKWPDHTIKIAGGNGRPNAHRSHSHDDLEKHAHALSQRSRASSSRSYAPISATRSTAGTAETRQHCALTSLQRHQDIVYRSEGAAYGHQQTVAESNEGAAEVGAAGRSDMAEHNISSDGPQEIGPLSDLSLSSSTSNSRSMMEKAAEVLASLRTTGESPPTTDNGDEDATTGDKTQVNEGEEDCSTRLESSMQPSSSFEEGQGENVNHESPAPSSPLSPLSSDDEQEEQPSSSRQGVVTRSNGGSKRASSSAPPADTSTRTSFLVSEERRNFPSSMTFDDSYPLLYQRFYVPSSLPRRMRERIFGGSTAGSFDKEVKKEAVTGIKVPKRSMYKEPPSLLNLYAPRYIRGQGMIKEGLCPVCWESGEERFFKIKQSSYNYHMQYTHGISAVTGEPFAPPIAFRTVERPKKDIRPFEKETIKEGRCHVCHKFIAVENVKQTEIKVPDCQRNGKPLAGASGTFVENAFYQRVKAFTDAQGSEEMGETRRRLLLPEITSCDTQVIDRDSTSW
ncbi:hypothetical protein CF327_g4282 [Tilletia walkeri]|nr:hypothetical protein CF327_g4282 [Tilletia walkeri]